ncbi:Uncharacterised protein [Mycobacterium tuberculosis]|nr:Uncharacterised protein [Mycobacterium tuberculosis]
MLRDKVEKRVDLVFVVSAPSERRLRENHVADLLGTEAASRRIPQRRLDEVEKRVDLVFVIAAFSDGGFGERHVVDQLCGEATVGRVHQEMVAPRPRFGGY